MTDTNPAAQAQADAAAALARAEAEAAALLADLEAKDHSAPPKVTHALPSPYAPGELPPDPVKGVGEPEGYKNQLYNALEGNFKPVNLDDMRIPTNTASVTVDFAQKIRDANKYGKQAKG